MKRRASKSGGKYRTIVRRDSPPPGISLESCFGLTFFADRSAEQQQKPKKRDRRALPAVVMPPQTAREASHEEPAGESALKAHDGPAHGSVPAQVSQEPAGESALKAHDGPARWSVQAPVSQEPVRCSQTRRERAQAEVEERQAILADLERDAVSNLASCVNDSEPDPLGQLWVDPSLTDADRAWADSFFEDLPEEGLLPD